MYDCSFQSHIHGESSTGNEVLSLTADDEVSLPAQAPPSVQPSIPDSPTSSSAPDTSTRLSTAHSMADEEEEVRGPQAAPASATSSSLTQGNLDHMTSAAAAARTPPTRTTLQLDGTLFSSQQRGIAHPLATTASPGGSRDLDPSASGGDTQTHRQDMGTPAPSGAGRVSGEAAFGSWATAAEHSDWAALEWLACKALPALLASVRMVTPQTETEALR